MNAAPLSLQARYELAARMAFGQREARLLRGAVRPMWAADSTHFWYVTREADGLRHVLVDVLARQQQDLFDHQALANALSRATGTPVSSGTLALSGVRLHRDAGLVHFLFGGARWQWHLAAATLGRQGPAFAPHEVACPDGRRAALLQGSNLALRDAEAAQVLPVTKDGEPDWGYGDFTDFTSQVMYAQHGIPRAPSVQWSPDSQALATLRVDRRSIPRNHLVQSVPAQGVRPRLYSCPFPTPEDPQGAAVALWFIGVDGQRVRAQIDGLECRAVTPLALNEAWWSRDSRYFHLIDISRDSKRLTLWRVDARTGAAEKWFEQTGPGVVLASPAISEPAVFRDLSDGRCIVWSQSSGWGHLCMLTPGRQPMPITQGKWIVRSLLHVDTAGQRIVFTASGREPGVDPYFCAAYSVCFDGTGLTLLTPEPAHHEFMQALPGGDGCSSVSPDGRWLVDTHSTVTEPPHSLLRHAATGAWMMALQTADPQDTWPPSQPLPEPFSVQALDPAPLDGADDLWGLLYKPAGFDASRSYAVVEVIYGWPQTTVVAKGWLNNFHASVAEQLAALGFVAVMFDGPGTTYRSHALQCANHGNLQNCDSLPDHVNAIRTLAPTRPWMDLGRVGVVGGSAGGYAAVRAMANFPDFYKVGMGVCGAHNLRGIVATWGDRYQGLYEAPMYAQLPNATVAANITGELLLIHGDMDDNVHPALTMQLVDALIKADRNFDLLIVPNAGHGVIAQPYAQRRFFDFFVERLMGERPPSKARPCP
jgi:dipeptidyl-peptidase 4